MARLTWQLELPKGRVWRIGEHPAILGVLNLTPDSFSDGGRHLDPDEAVEAGLQLVQEGADAIDIGGESTRPGSLPVSPEEQLGRVLPVLRGLRGRTEVPLSIDTTSPRVAAACLEAGADIVNDIAGFRENGWQEVLSAWRVPVILTHMLGTPRTMQESPTYPGGATASVRAYFQERVAVLESWGVESDRLILDPGIGFGKLLQHNLELIRNIEELRVWDRPVLLGLSRKGFIGQVLDRELDMRDVGTVAANAAAVFAGANILRVHNVPYTRDLVWMLRAIGDGKT